MSGAARVTSIEAIETFRAALCAFAEDAKSALGSVEMEVRRTTDWLAREQLFHWQSQVKRCELEMKEAQAALFRRKLSQQPNSPPNDSQQKEDLRQAKRRLEFAEEKVKLIKKWTPVLERAVAEYHSRAHPLSDQIEGDLDRSLVLLDRMVAALDAYVKLAPPTAPRPAPTGPAPAVASMALAAASPPSMAEPVAEPVPAESGADVEDAIPVEEEA